MPDSPFPVDLIIWDLDGTLCDTAEDITDSLNRTLIPMGLDMHDVPTVKSFIGGGIANLISRAMDCETDDPRVKRCVSAFRDDYNINLTRKTRFFPGAQEMLEHFAAKKQAVISNKLQYMTRTIVEKLGEGERFTDIIGQAGDYPIKPDPTSTLAMIEKHGTTPERTAFIGDSDTDHKTARAAGCLSIMVTFGMRPRDEVINYGADAWVDDLTALHDVLI